MANITPRLRRFSFLRFRLWTLFALMLLIAIPLAWKCKKVSDQRAVARAVEQTGGTVAYDYEIAHLADPNDLEPARPAAPGPLWLQSILGSDFFAEIKEVELHPPPNPNLDEDEKAFEHALAMSADLPR